MKFTFALIAGALIAASPVLAVYAPLPEPEQGKQFVVSVSGGVSYDSNIFGAAGSAISSTVWEIAPSIAYNASVTDQTFISASYGLTLDDFERRPGQKVLDSHTASLRLAHAFSKSTIIDLNNDFTIARNPQSLLNGVPLNTDQSVTQDQFDGHFTMPITPKIGTELKMRTVYYKYRDAVLGRSLDRIENLYGVAGDYAVLPEMKAVVEYRHQDVYYRKLGELKNKSTEYLMTGVDYAAARKLTLSARLGGEWRKRSAEPSGSAPYAEFSGRYDYAKGSFVTGGYAYTFDETSDPARFNDEKVNRFFIDVEHAVTALIVASASVDYEPAVLEGRGVQPNLNETTSRVGGALTYVPTKTWRVTASYDYDRVRSDDPLRSVERHRIGINASYSF